MYGTNGDRFQVAYRNRFGRRRNYSTAFEGIVRGLERRYRETDSEFVKEKIEEYMTLRPCPECKGARLRPESRAVLVSETPIREFTALSVRNALTWVRGLELSEHDYRIARLVLREIEEMDYRQIATIANIPIGTVMSRLARARAALRARWEAEAGGRTHAVR